MRSDFSRQSKNHKPQIFYVAQYANNFMMSLNVEDANAWWEHIQREEYTKKYPGIISAGDAAMWNSGALPERSYWGSVAHHRHA
jgi:hypothetical protein